MGSFQAHEANGLPEANGPPKVRGPRGHCTPLPPSQLPCAHKSLTNKDVSCKIMPCRYYFYYYCFDVTENISPKKRQCAGPFSTTEVLYLG